jgi:hypothetical protein
LYSGVDVIDYGRNVVAPLYLHDIMGMSLPAHDLRTFELSFNQAGESGQLLIDHCSLRLVFHTLPLQHILSYAWK